MKLLTGLLGSVSGLVLLSCVTINIYFPAAAAEKAADRIIEDVWGAQKPPAEQPESAPAEQPTSKLQQSHSLGYAILNYLVPVAQAAQANLNIDSPAISAIQNKMKQRHEALKPFYQSGVVGLTADGLVKLRDAKAVALQDRNKVNALIANENADRQNLYAEIARANGHPEWEADIQATFATRWINKAAKGWWYQQGGSWKQK